MVAPTRNVEDHAVPQLTELRQRAEQLRASIQMTEYELSGCRQHIAELMSSTSWRITEPFRKLRGVLSRGGKLSMRRAAHATFVRSAAPAVSHTPAQGGIPSATFRTQGAGKKAADAAFSGIRELHTVALTERSLAARDLITRAATAAVCDFRGLSERFAADAEQALASCVEPMAIRMLARVVAGQADGPLMEALALQLYGRHRDLTGGADWELADHVGYVDLLCGAGEIHAASGHLDLSGLRQMSPMDYHCLRANLLLAAGKESSSSGWLSALNALFESAGLESVQLAEGDAAPLDRLVCQAPASSVSDAPLVSVLMTTFQPDVTTDTAIAAVLAQTWRNLELIIVDDASPEADFRRLAQWGERDNRVRVLRAEHNGGTYAAKNLGLAQARGRFVTCHDSDDWSHPRKLEIQARHLLANATAIGNLSCLARVSPALAFLRFSLQGKLVYLNTSSLMFRRKDVVDRIGFWDPVRYGADTEYYKRMETAFGQKLTVLDSAPLSFGRTHDRSLTSGTLGRGFISFERRWYQSAWMEWHRSIARKSLSPRLDMDAPRPFPVPLALTQPTSSNAAPAKFDSVLVADYCLPDRNAKAFAREIETRLDKGQKVAICQVRTLHTGAVAKRFADERIQRLVNERRVAVVKLEDALACDELVVLYPRVFEFTTYQTTEIQASRVRIAGDSAADLPLVGEDQPLDWKTCRAEAERLFGRLGTRDDAGNPADCVDADWNQHDDHLYHFVAKTLVETLLDGRASLIDVSSDRHSHLEWFPKVSRRTSIGSRRPPDAADITAITEEFLHWEPDANYDVAVCLQALEHVPDATAFARKLLEIADVLVVGVAYKWEAGYGSSHGHDPVDEEKLRSWFKREPNFEYLCREVGSGRERLLQVYERDSMARWPTLNERTNLGESGNASS